MYTNAGIVQLLADRLVLYLDWVKSNRQRDDVEMIGGSNVERIILLKERDDSQTLSNRNSVFDAILLILTK